MSANCLAFRPPNNVVLWEFLMLYVVSYLDTDEGPRDANVWLPVYPGLAVGTSSEDPTSTHTRKKPHETSHW